MDIPDTNSKTLSELKVGDILLDELFSDFGGVSSISFYRVIRINKKTISTRRCNRSGALDMEDKEVYYSLIWEQNRYPFPQKWSILA